MQDFHVYYHSWPHKRLRQVTAHCETAGEAIADVAALLKEENEAYCKPLLAMVVGGKAL